VRSTHLITLHARPARGADLNRTTVVAVSTSVIVVAAIIIISVLGVWWYRWHRRERQIGEDEEPDYYQEDPEWTGVPDSEKVGRPLYDQQRW
jgi:hypothetical protein